ncbi:hypothetical protein PHET_11005 [Paragonimus heterotremus]|uniref:G-protein coupled receptors family 2 profile 2 domain-containing protein n=1 Tax=Paragonimus heterotremus TaxID=100268 RepID=A0A8J4SL38_9TREM|nr:hypothetical protein PHET_11005 [Paragonimus heterotremus]
MECDCTKNEFTEEFNGKQSNATKKLEITTEGIDPETYTITKICFTLALLFALLHLLLNLRFRSIRRLYGTSVFVGLVWFCAAQLTTLVSCCLTQDATVATNLMSSVAICRQFWLSVGDTPMGPTKLTADVLLCEFGHVTIRWHGKIIYWIFWLLVSVALPLSVVVINIYVFDSNAIHSFHTEFSNISCNLIPNSERFRLFFPSLLLLLFFQLICVAICAKLLQGLQSNCTLWAQLSYLVARYWIVTKLSLTHCVVWASAFAASYYASVTMWHVFTLFCSLQTIYIAVNCTFSRPVLDLIHQWQEDKTEAIKTDHAILMCGFTRKIYRGSAAEECSIQQNANILVNDR